jgi:ubiquinone/menaquinone biosynthesis C-methylase UbiE
LVRANSEKLPLQPIIFDAVICACALEHFENDSAALREFFRVLKPGGSLILTADSLTYPMPQRIKDRHRVKNFVVNYYLLPDLVAKIEGSGFAMLEAKYFLN